MRFPFLLGGAILLSAFSHSATASTVTVSAHNGYCNVLESGSSAQSTSCNGAGALESASAGGGHLSVLATAYAFRGGGDLAFSGAGQAIAYMDDIIHFGVDEGVFVIPLDFSGKVETAASLESPGSSVQNMGGSIGGGFNADHVNLASFSYSSSESVNQTTDTFTESGEMSLVKLAAISFTGGQTSISAGLRADAACGAVGMNSSCSVAVDYSHSLRFLAGLLYDLDGNPLPDVSVTSDSGFDYLTGVPPHVSAVPLPATLPLLASGFGLLGLGGWRRRHRAS